MIRQTTTLKQNQRLSPQQIQLMKLIQIPTATLDQRIQEELEANPALDEGEELENENEGGESSLSEETDYAEERGEEPAEEFELDDYLVDYIEDDPTSYKLQSNNNFQQEENTNIPYAVENSFYEHLEEQLGMLNFEDEREFFIALQIIGSIDKDGYLRRDPISIIDDLQFIRGIIATEKEIITQIKRIQRFDPPGVGAKNLKECLLIQLLLKKERLDISDQNHPISLSIRILEDYFNEFSKKHYSKLQRLLGITEEQLKDCNNEIQKLNPKPASGYRGSGGAESQYIIPDFIITNRDDGELELILNSKNAPDLRINDQYKGILKNFSDNKKGSRFNKKEKEAVLFVKQKIDSAKWFIDAIKQRQQTMFKAMYSIMNYQYEYFETGDDQKLKPMILKDIADITGLDISTISRVANSKFVQTEFGTKRLKDFFSEAIKREDGEEVSTFEVKKILAEIIDEESKKKPLSDEKLKNMLTDKGYVIARRTVAKYREQLGIPVARLRKEI